MKKKKGQEEMIGFALIIVLVAVVLLVFLRFSLNDSEKDIVESYEVESFISSLLQHTTECGNNREAHLEIQKLIPECINQKKCLDGKNSCEVLEKTLKEVIGVSWNVGENTPVKGYKLEILSDNRGVIPSVYEGEGTNNYKGASQNFDTLDGNYEIIFRAYY